MKFNDITKPLFFIALLVFPLSLQSQIRGIVIEKDTRLPIPFVSVNYVSDGQTKVVIADKSGNFVIDDHNVESLQITCVGYLPKHIKQPAKLPQPITIEMEEQSITLGEVLVSPKNNPAHRIIRLAIENKSQNNFEKYDQYSYRNYLKSTFEILFADNNKDRKDSMAYVSETVVQATKQGSRSEEKIIANRSSGFKSPIWGQTMYSMFYKAVSFYNSSIPIFSTNQPADRMSYEYLTPLSDGSISIYNFTLENNFINENGTDTIFEISYFPKKNTNINGLQGTLFISSNGYALTCVVAQPYERKGMDFYFKQEYKKIEGKWFPSTLEQMVRMGKFDVFNISSTPVFSIVSHISDVSYTIDRKLPNRLEQLYLDEDSIEYNLSRFDSIRPIPMTSKEINYYNQTDSFFNDARKEGLDFDYLISMMTKLPEYKIQVKNFDFDLGRIYSQNFYEKMRLGLGVYTNEHLVKWLSVGGYFGYGTGDKRWKYGGEIEWTFQKSHDLKLKYQYQNSLKEAGKNLPSNSYEWNANYLRNLIANRFDRVIEHKFEVRYHPFRPLQLKTSFSSKNMTPLYDYTYGGDSLSNFVTDDINFSLRYAVKEIYSTLGYERVKIKEGNPIFNLSYTRGINRLRAKSPIYNKFEISIDIRAYNGRIGQSNLRVAGGYIDSDLPYGLLFTGEGSRDKLISLLIPNTFQTMRPYDFLSDRYVHLFYSHNFGALLLKTRHFSPEFVVAYNAAWGKLSHPQNHNLISFQQHDCIYQEAGLIIKKIVQISLPFYSNATFDLGFGGYYRLNGSTNWKDNTALKMAFSLTL